MTRYTTANFSSCWFHFYSIFFLNLSSLFHFQYYKPLVFWPLYHLNFQHDPKVIFSSLAWHSRPSVHPNLSFQSQFSVHSPSIILQSHQGFTSSHRSLLKSTHFSRPRKCDTIPTYFFLKVSQYSSLPTLRPSKLCSSFVDNICTIIACIQLIFYSSYCIINHGRSETCHVCIPYRTQENIVHKSVLLNSVSTI